MEAQGDKGAFPALLVCQQLLHCFCPSVLGQISLKVPPNPKYSMILQKELYSLPKGRVAGGEEFLQLPKGGKSTR